MKSQTALITGASGGIGLELAKLFARDKYNLVLVARSAQKLQELASELQAQHKIPVATFHIDLTEVESANQLFSQLQHAGTHIDILVNNAGFGRFGELRTSL